MVLSIVIAIIVIIGLVWSNVFYIRKYNGEKKEFDDLSESYLNNVSHVNAFVGRYLDKTKLYKDTGIILKSGSPEDIRDFVKKADKASSKKQDSSEDEIKKEKEAIAERSLDRFVNLQESLEPIIIDGAEFEIVEGSGGIYGDSYYVDVTKGHYSEGFRFTLTSKNVISVDSPFSSYGIGGYEFLTDLNYEGYSIEELKSSEWIIKEFKIKWDNIKDKILSDEDYVLKAKKELEKVNL